MKLKEIWKAYCEWDFTGHEMIAQLKKHSPEQARFRGRFIRRLYLGTGTFLNVVAMNQFFPMSGWDAFTIILAGMLGLFALAWITEIITTLKGY